MTWKRYSVYFLVEGHELAGYRTFVALSDFDARQIAGTVFELCQDACQSVEVWRDGELLFRLAESDLAQPFQLNVYTASAVLELEEALAESRWAIARSRRLLARLGRAPS
jgi:hypothetical protein